jgi:hypothetical protein
MRRQSIRQRSVLAAVFRHYEPQAKARREFAVARNALLMLREVDEGKRLFPHEPYVLDDWRSKSESISTLRAVGRLVDEGLLVYGPPWRNQHGRPSKSVFLTAAGYRDVLAHDHDAVKVALDGGVHEHERRRVRSIIGSPFAHSGWSTWP